MQKIFTAMLVAALIMTVLGCSPSTTKTTGDRPTAIPKSPATQVFRVPQDQQGNRLGLDLVGAVYRDFSEASKRAGYSIPRPSRTPPGDVSVFVLVEMSPDAKEGSGPVPTSQLVMESDGLGPSVYLNIRHAPAAEDIRSKKPTHSVAPGVLAVGGSARHEGVESYLEWHQGRLNYGMWSAEVTLDALVKMAQGLDLGISSESSDE